jgi:CRP-like cAMP-binding protein
MKVVSYKSGEVVIAEGSGGDSLFIIRKGSMEVYKTWGQCIAPDGAKQI